MYSERNTKDVRNRRISEVMEHIGNEAALLSAKTERLRILRDHYEAYLNRVYPIKKDYLIEMYDTKNHCPETIYLDEPSCLIYEFRPQTKGSNRSYFEENVSPSASELDFLSTPRIHSRPTYLNETQNLPDYLSTSELSRNVGVELIDLKSPVSEGRDIRSYPGDLVKPILTTNTGDKLGNSSKSSRENLTFCDNCERLRRRQTRTQSFSVGSRSYDRSSPTRSDSSRSRFRSFSVRNSKSPLSGSFDRIGDFQSFPKIRETGQNIGSRSVFIKMPPRKSTYIDDQIKSKLENCKLIIDRYSRSTPSWNAVKNSSMRDDYIDTYLKKNEGRRLAGYNDSFDRHSLLSKSFLSDSYSSQYSNHDYPRTTGKLMDRDTGSYSTNLYRHVIFAPETTSFSNSISHKNSNSSILHGRGGLQSFNYPSYTSSLSSYPSTRSANVCDIGISSAGQNRSYLNVPSYDSEFQKVPVYQRYLSADSEGDFKKSRVKFNDVTEYDRDELGTNTSENKTNGSSGQGLVEGHGPLNSAEGKPIPDVVVTEENTEGKAIEPQNESSEVKLENTKRENENIGANNTDTKIQDNGDGEEDENNNKGEKISSKTERGKIEKCGKKEEESISERSRTEVDSTNSERRGKLDEPKEKVTENIESEAFKADGMDAGETRPKSIPEKTETETEENIENEVSSAALKAMDKNEIQSADGKLTRTDSARLESDPDRVSVKKSAEFPQSIKSETVDEERAFADVREKEVHDSSKYFTSENPKLNQINQLDTDLTEPEREIAYGANQHPDAIKNYPEEVAQPLYDGVNQEFEGHTDEQYDMYQHQPYTNQEQPLDEQRQYENMPQQRYEEQPQLEYDGHPQQYEAPYEENQQHPYDMQDQPPYDDQRQQLYDEQQYTEQQEPYDESMYEGSRTQYKNEPQFVEPQDSNPYPEYENTQERVYDESQPYAQDEYDRQGGHGSQELHAPESSYAQDGRTDYAGYQDEYPVNNDDYRMVQQREEYPPNPEGEDYTRRVPEEYGSGYEHQQVPRGEYEEPVNTYGEVDESQYVHRREEYGRDGYDNREYPAGQGDYYEPNVDYSAPEYGQDPRYSDDPQKYPERMPEEYERKEMTQELYPQDAYHAEYTTQQEVPRQGNPQYEETKAPRGGAETYQEPYRKTPKV